MAMPKKPKKRMASPKMMAKPKTPKKRRTTMIRPEQLASARFAAPSTIELEFLDSRYSLDISRLGMPVERIDWPTLKISPGGEKIVVKGIKGDPVPIDAATLRYLVDEKYAAKIDKSLESLRLSRDELAEMARDNPPPPAWYDEPERDLSRESWK